MTIVRRDAVSDAEREALRSGTLIALRSDVARFELTGKGRVACLQGLVSCDVEKTDGARSLFGALLTTKGMIVAPLWIVLDADTIRLEAPASAASALGEVFARTLPPRLCQWRDVTAGTTSLGWYGPGAAPPEGGGGGAWPALARGMAGWELHAMPDEAEGLIDRSVAGGAVRAGTALLERCRIEAGIPRLGDDIDERTLPQEARLDELGGVSYTKGCYLGQETVARLHFRGHANRRLVSVDLAAEPAALPADVMRDGRPVGRLGSAAWSDAAGRWIGLALLRREIEAGAELLAGDMAVSVRGARWLRPA